jgi:hypothetical protein
MLFLLAGDPHSIPTATGDPFKTLFVARIVSVTADVSIFHAPFQLIHTVVIKMMLIIAGLHFSSRTMTLQSQNCEENLKCMDQ